jgi:hypothetical protein
MHSSILCHSYPLLTLFFFFVVFRACDSSLPCWDLPALHLLKDDENAVLVETKKGKE